MFNLTEYPYALLTSERKNETGTLHLFKSNLERWSLEAQLIFTSVVTKTYRLNNKSEFVSEESAIYQPIKIFGTNENPKTNIDGLKIELH